MDARSQYKQAYHAKRMFLIRLTERQQPVEDAEFFFRLDTHGVADEYILAASHSFSETERYQKQMKVAKRLPKAASVSECIEYAEFSTFNDIELSIIFDAVRGRTTKRFFRDAFPGGKRHLARRLVAKLGGKL